MNIYGSKRMTTALVLAIVTAVSIAVFRTAVAEEVVRVSSDALVSYPFNVEDERLLVGAADQVFVGSVIDKVGPVAPQKAGQAIPPRTRFSVETLRNIKGESAGTVVVSQDGGYVEYRADKNYPRAKVQKGILVVEKVLVNDEPLLKPGREYLFVTTELSNGTLQITAAGPGNILISGEQQKTELVKKFRKARANQIDPAIRGPLRNPPFASNGE